MNYGQSLRYKGLDQVSYEYEIPIQEFLTKTSGWFDKYRKESIIDSEMEKPGEYPLQDKYRENGFPDLDEMILKYKELLGEMVIYFDLDILNLLIDTCLADDLEEKYLINSLDWFKIEDCVLLGGTSFILHKLK
jgi:hypothetical protein